MKIKNVYRVTLKTEVEVIIDSDMPIDEAHVDDTCDKQEVICKELVLSSAPKIDILGTAQKYMYTIESIKSEISRCQLKELDIENKGNRNFQ